MTEVTYRNVLAQICGKENGVIDTVLDYDSNGSSHRGNFSCLILFTQTVETQY